MDGSKKKTHPTILSLNEQEFYFLSELLKKGYPLLEALSFLKKDDTRVKEALESGVSIQDIFLSHHKGRFYMHFAFFLEVSSLADAIESALHMMSFEKGIKKKLVKQCTYPLFLLVFSFIILIFFSRFIIPQMLNSFDAKDDFALLISLLSLLQYVFYFLLGIVLCFACFFLYGSFQPLKQSVWLYQHHQRVPLLKDIISYQLAGYLYELEAKGISTKAAFHYLLHLKETSILHHFMKDIIFALESGAQLHDVLDQSTLLSSSFKQMFYIGAHNDNICEMMELFMKQQELYWEKLIKKAGASIQCLAYVFIACMVLSVYQIMLIPLQMLDTM